MLLVLVVATIPLFCPLLLTFPDIEKREREREREGEGEKEKKENQRFPSGGRSIASSLWNILTRKTSSDVRLIL